jgi:3-hydroxybutyryl-CoA dehydratase
MMRPRRHERFATTVRLTPSTVSAFAEAAGDHNPLHHDADYAAHSRYLRPIASGTQTASHLMALTATHFSTHGAVVGLEFCVRFRRPVYADEVIHLEWLVVRVKENPRLGGDVVELRGRVRNEAGETAVAAKGRVLVSARI